MHSDVLGSLVHIGSSQCIEKPCGFHSRTSLIFLSVRNLKFKLFPDVELSKSILRILSVVLKPAHFIYDNTEESDIDCVLVFSNISFNIL